MQSGGVRESQLCESNSHKVYPQPMEEYIRQNPQALETLISKLFTNISSLKSAYMQLQAAHTPYDPVKIQAADKLIIKELKTLSELKHFYRENNPKPICVSPQDSRLAAEIQEQQSLLKTYEVMVKKFQSEIQNKDSDILELQKQIREATQKGAKLEKSLKLRGLEDSGEVDNTTFPMDLTPNHFTLAVESAFKSIHDFSKILMNLLKAAGLDLDSCAKSIDPKVIYSKRADQKYAFDHFICRALFIGFDKENYSLKAESLANITKEGFFGQYMGLRDRDPLEVLTQYPDSIFGKFCTSKYLTMLNPRMESSIFGNLDHRTFVEGGGHPRTPFYHGFLKLAKSVWLVHLLAYSFEPNAKVFDVKRGNEYNQDYMESVVAGITIVDGQKKPQVGVMVMPGFWVGGNVIRSRVYLTSVA